MSALLFQLNVSQAESFRDRLEEVHSIRRRTIRREVGERLRALPIARAEVRL